MKTNRLWVLSLLVVGCGGSSATPAPHTGGTPAPTSSEATAAAPPPPTPGADEKAPMSEEVVKGSKALEAGDVAGAKAAFAAAVAKNAKDADAHYYLGVLAEKAADKKTAEAEYKESLADRPGFEPAGINLGALYIDSERYDEALLVTRQALEKHPKSPSLELNLAVALAGKGDQGASLTAFEEAHKSNPSDPMTLVLYAHWLGVWKRNDDAADKLRQARPLAKSDVSMLGAIGHEMLLARDVEDCIPTLDKAIGIKDGPDLRTDRGICKMAAKNNDGAVADFKASIGLDPKYALAHYWLGVRLAADAKDDAKKAKEAIAEFETYAKLEPNGPLAKQAADHAKVLKEKKPKK